MVALKITQMKKRYDPPEEGSTREWQDRARVMLNTKEALKKDASPKQSPVPEEDVEEKSPEITGRKKGGEADKDPVY